MQSVQDRNGAPRAGSSWGSGVNREEGVRKAVRLPPQGDDGVGRFYSARSQFVGRWRLEKNTLLLSWDSEKNIDIVRAMETEKHWSARGARERTEPVSSLDI